MNNATILAASKAVLAVYRSAAAKGMSHDAAQEFAVSETCAMLGLDRAKLETALETLAD